ncbi:NAD(P)H-dependent flavin oxidoreductase [Marinobacter panjinensis]|uniref:NAD(P)H-dependent flavin oxidoreductase n=1 Tax=Marinobacter panjinensis TaxID=2576384 RepID=UPI001D17ED72|nr:nitronate monooxygenase [Marinobacter panjinensis]MCR8915713.1 nitronate monooxygenase [Marinobacter panjinensis]
MAIRLTEILRIDHPIIQAPMAGVSTPRLAAAVSNSGALGSISVGASNPQAARAMIADTRALTDRSFNVNVFCHRPAISDIQRERQWLGYLAPFFEEFDAEPPSSLREIYQTFSSDSEMLKTLVDERPAVVSFHFGLPPQGHIEALKKAGVFLIATATTVEEGARIKAAGIDAIVAQGLEAGGHRGMFNPELGDPGILTLELVQALKARVDLPVIAAGGIMDGRDISKALALGAEAAQLGTAFVLCPESSANEGYRDRLKTVEPGDTQITAAISGRPARGIINRMHREIGASTAPRLPDYPIAYDAAKALHGVASAKGSDDFAAHWAGQGASRAREMAAADLIEVLVSEMHGNA